MEQRISLITLGVADLQRTVDFYERVVGWKPEASPPGVVFFFDRSGKHCLRLNESGSTVGLCVRLGRGRHHNCQLKA